MKKTKRYSGEDGISDVEDMKANANEGKGIFSGKAAPDESDTYAPKTRSFSKTGPAPRPRVQKPAPRGSQSFPISVSTMESGADVMRRGRAGESDSGRNPSLDRLMSDRERAKEANASREARRKSAMVDKAIAGVPERRSNVDVAKERLGLKKGGSVGSASKRADGIAQKGKTKGRMV
jgi:hypothetical protein